MTPEGFVDWAPEQLAPNETMLHRPDPSEYNPYYDGYIRAAGEGDIIQILADEGENAVRLFDGIEPERGRYRYEEGKWSLAEVLGHIVDTERLFSYRALRIARGDTTPMPGMDQDQWVAGSDFDARGLASLSKEFLALRASNISLFSSFTDEECVRIGNASGFDFSVRALIYITAGHAMHHVRVIEDRYLP